ncbi:NAD-dependent epimerase/dehydratase family protein [Candidatus Uhrbacteria bacterium]|nr:NAD-dependent epimerase/dehydratase family protein [Candidatus Uhrbacteria bacterium]
MKVFLTGATGFLGKHIAQEVVKRGHDLTCLVRDNSQVADVRLIPARIVKGDVKDYNSLVSGLSGQDAVIHAAGVYKFGPAHHQDIHDVNVKGTENVMLAAVKMKVDKIVYCGSAISLGAAKHADQPLDESSDRQTPFESQYEKSKSLAQQKVANFVRQGAPIVSVLPSHIYGPGDPHGYGSIIRRYLAGDMHVGLKAPYKASMVHVQDVAKGVVDALEKGKPGQSYILSGENVGWEEFLFLLENETGITRPAVNVGLKFAKLLGYGSDLVSKITKKSGKISVESVNQLQRNLVFSNDKAQLELGWAPRPFKQGFKETVDAFKKELART